MCFSRGNGSGAVPPVPPFLRRPEVWVESFTPSRLRPAAGDLDWIRDGLTDFTPRWRITRADPSLSTAARERHDPGGQSREKEATEEAAVEDRNAVLPRQGVGRQRRADVRGHLRRAGNRWLVRHQRPRL